MDAVKGIAIVCVMVALAVFFAVVVSNLGSAALQTQASFYEYQDGDYGAGAHLNTSAEIGRSLLIEPLFGDHWVLLVEIVSSSLIAALLGWALLALVRAVVGS